MIPTKILKAPYPSVGLDRTGRKHKIVMVETDAGTFEFNDLARVLDIPAATLRTRLWRSEGWQSPHALLPPTKRGHKLGTQQAHTEVEWCPAVMPRKSGDWSGRKIGKLSYIEPLFRCGKHWYYLVECDCGNDSVVRAVKGDAASCGCVSTKHGYKPSEDENSTWGMADDDDGAGWGPAGEEFNRMHCLRDRITCRHFSACQDERVFGGMKVSSRYEAMNGNCYDGGEKDVRI